MNHNHNVTMGDILNVDLIQNLLECFATTTGLAVVAVDLEKNFTTEINFTDFCMKYTRGSQKGLCNCIDCDLHSAEAAIKEGRPVIYTCKTGLTDFAVPILLENEQIGSILCGQVLLEAPDIDKFREKAREYGIDEEKYIEALKKVKIVQRQKLEAAADLLFVMAKNLSDAAYKNYKLMKNTAKQRIISSVIEEINSTFDIDKILEVVCSSLAQMFNIERVIVIDFAKKTNMLLKEYKTEDKYGNLVEDMSKSDYVKLIGFVNEFLRQSKNSKIAWFDRSIFNLIPKFVQKIVLDNDYYSLVSANIQRDSDSCIELLLESHNPYHEWSDDDKNFLSLITKQISIALKQAKLYNQQKIHREREKAILNNSPYVAWLKECTGKYIAVNKRFCRYVGVDSEAEVLNKSDSDFFDGKAYERYRAEDLYILKNKKEYSAEIEIIVDGVKKIIQIFKTPVFNDVGEIWAIAGYSRDITNEKQVEQVKSEFVSIVSHELRTPLTSIIGSLDLINSNLLGDLPPKIHELLDISQKNSYRLLKLINDILDVEKIEAGEMDFKMTEVNFQNAIKDTINSLEEYAVKYKTQIVQNEMIKDVFIKADVDRLVQIFTNLVSNAIKFTKDGQYVVVASTLKKDNVVFSVTNCGFEIPVHLRDDLFKKFYQINSSDSRKKDGTGLGLNIAKALTEKMGGAIDFTSFDGQTTFTVTFPVEKIAK